MSNKYKFTLPISNNKFIDIPIQLKWDFFGRLDSIQEYENTVIEEIIGSPLDYEIDRFAHDSYGEDNVTKIYYNFYFFNGVPTDIPTSISTDWDSSYITEGFSGEEIYFLVNQFTKSFFKLDFYDTQEAATQKNYFTVILPVTEGENESILVPMIDLVNNVFIKKPTFELDYIKKNEGFYFYWLRDRTVLDISTFYMTAKFFDAKSGVFVKMMTEPQSNLPGDRFSFKPEDYFYYKVVLDYNNYSYKVYNVLTNFRVGDNLQPINWYEYVNPQN